MASVLARIFADDIATQAAIAEHEQWLKAQTPAWVRRRVTLAVVGGRVVSIVAIVGSWAAAWGIWLLAFRFVRGGTATGIMLSLVLVAIGVMILSVKAA